VRWNIIYHICLTIYHVISSSLSHNIPSHSQNLSHNLPSNEIGLADGSIEIIDVKTREKICQTSEMRWDGWWMRWLLFHLISDRILPFKKNNIFSSSTITRWERWDLWDGGRWDGGWDEMIFVHLSHNLPSHLIYHLWDRIWIWVIPHLIFSWFVKWDDGRLWERDGRLWERW